jgi:hypothetical protein
MPSPRLHLLNTYREQFVILFKLMSYEVLFGVVTARCFTAVIYGEHSKAAFRRFGLTTKIT